MLCTSAPSPLLPTAHCGAKTSDPRTTQWDNRWDNRQQPGTTTNTSHRLTNNIPPNSHLFLLATWHPPVAPVSPPASIRLHHHPGPPGHHLQLMRATTTDHKLVIPVHSLSVFARCLCHSAASALPSRPAPPHLQHAQLRLTTHRLTCTCPCIHLPHCPLPPSRTFYCSTVARLLPALCLPIPTSPNSPIVQHRSYTSAVHISHPHDVNHRPHQPPASTPSH